MEFIKYLMLGIFIVATFIHLVASKKKNQKLRNITKPFILSSLTGFYILGAEKVLLAFVLALVFSWLGDLLLIPKGVKWFTTGGICFGLGHLCFMASYYVDLKAAGGSISIPLLIIMAAIDVAAVVIIFHNLKQHLPRGLFAPMFAYLISNGAMNTLAVVRLASLKTLPSVLTAAGALLFFVSDTTLFFVRFNKNAHIKDHFRVMLTYSVGELLILLGML